MVPNVLGGKFKMKSPGSLKFALKGKECSLQPVEEDDGKLFIIFGDKSNLNETYKSGRFLYADKPVNGEAVLDFNKAENPPCAFTPFATCPLPPPGNSLDVEIKAGFSFVRLPAFCPWNACLRGHGIKNGQPLTVHR